MTAVTSLIVRTGAYSLTPGVADRPDVYAHIHRRGLRIAWRISVGRNGWVFAWGRTWTRGGALVEAIAAANRPRKAGGPR